MKLEEFRKIILEEISKQNIIINENEINKLYNYMIEILEWNKKVNLTAITEYKMFIVKHFVDSLTVCKYIKNEKSLIDIGTGAGFPGIPIKIHNNNLKVTLIDSINKKLNVIKDISRKIGLDNLEILHARAEELGKNKEYRESYDFATTRAVSNLNTIAEYMLPFVKIGGYAICMKGPNYFEELENSKNAIEILGGNIEKIDSFVIDNELERNIILIKKIKKTPIKYPRGLGKPLKDPIK